MYQLCLKWIYIADISINNESIMHSFLFSIAVPFILHNEEGLG